MSKIDIEITTKGQEPIEVTLNTSNPQDSPIKKINNQCLKRELTRWESFWKTVCNFFNLDKFKPHHIFKVEVATDKSDNNQVKDEHEEFKPKAFYIEYGNKKEKSVVIDIDKDKYSSFTLYFDPSKIYDILNPTIKATKIEKEKSSSPYRIHLSIPYTITVTDVTNKETVCQKDHNLPMIIIIPITENSYKIELKPIKELEFTTKQDTAQKGPKIADLKLSNLLPLVPIELSFSLEAQQERKSTKKGRNNIILDGNQVYCSEPKETHPRTSGEGVALKPGESLFHISRESNNYNVSGLYKLGDDGEINEVTIPIHIDISQLRNPENVEDNIELVVSHKKIGQNEPERKLTEQIKLKKNTTEPILDVILKDPNKAGKLIEYDLLECEKIKLEQKVFGQGTIDIEIEFSNEAVDASEGIIVGGFNLDYDNAEGTIEILNGNNQYQNKKYNKNQCKDLIKLSETGPIILHSKNSEQDSFKLLLQIEPESFITNDNKTIYSATLIVPFTFEYYYCVTVNETNNYNGVWQTLKSARKKNFLKKKTCNLLVTIKRRDSEDWLCLDFGTSAVVALYGKLNSDSTPLPLYKYRQETIIQEVYPDKSDSKRIDHAEQSDYFLPSVTYFNHPNNGDYRECKPVKDFKDSAIWFSPTMGMVAGAGDYQLPSLKLILGFDTLPKNLFSEKVIKIFKYYVRNNGIIISQGLTDPNSPDMTEICRVETLIQIIYRQLFTYYLDPLAKKRDIQARTPLQNIVLAIPNTFTPKNKEMLKNLIQVIMPRIKKIYFVCESDAVACYYLANEEEFKKQIQAKVTENNSKQSQGNDDYLLIYDMGAGTLDLTYLHREDRDITIEGKMGVSKAGDYLDRIIAEILLELIEKKKNNNPEMGEPEIERSISNEKEEFEEQQSREGKLDTSASLTRSYPMNNNAKSNGTDANITELGWNKDSIFNYPSSSAHDLKNYVSRVVKPILSKDEDVFLPPFDDGKNIYNIPVNVGDIINHNSFKKYITETTVDILQQFKKLFGQGNCLNVDTLIFSGRGTKLRQIRDGVMDYLKNKEYNQRGKNCQFVDVKNKMDTQRPDALKTAVAQGALEYVHYFGGINPTIKSYNVYARYGMLYKGYKQNDNVIKWHFIPFIDCKTEPKTKAKTAKDGIYINEYEEEKSFNFTTLNVGEILIVQTYSDKPEQDWSVGNREMISVLFRQTCEDFKDGRNYQLTMKIDENNLLSFKIGQETLRTDPHMDFENDKSLQKSLWPVVINKQL